MKMEEGKFLSKDGKPLFILGVNYWSRHAGPLMWRKWDEEKVRAEIKQMKSLGMNTCRSFLYMPDFMPRPGHFDEEMLRRFATFLSICREEGFYTIPSFFVGHMSGENWDVPWREGRNFYSDPWMLRQEIAYVQRIVSLFKDEEAVLGWLLSNEIPLYGGNTTRDIGYIWARTICKAIKEIDPVHPVSIGDGAWFLNGEDNGFNLDDLSQVIDFIGPHSYPSETDSIRHSLIPAFLTQLAKTWGLPVLLEEFGCSNAHCNEEHQADYFRTTFHSVLINGGCGCLGWCFSDFYLPYQRPYSHHPYEMLFGVTRADGSPKSVAEEFQRFSSLLQKIDLSQVRYPQPQAFLLLPSYYFYPYPFWGTDKSLMYRTYLEAFTLAKMAHLTVGIVKEPPIISNIPYDIELPERMSFPPQAKLVMVPFCQALTAPTWEALYDFVKEGGTLYLSYRYQMWIHNFERLVGCAHLLRYGIPDVPPSDLGINFVKDLGDIRAGESFRFRVPPSPFLSAFCPLKAETAEVIAVDDQGNPALVLNKVGKGKVFFSAFPLEYYTLETLEGNRVSLLWRLYGAMAGEAGIATPVQFTNPFVEMEILQCGEAHLLWLVNHSWEEVEGTLLGDFKEVVDLETEESLPSSQTQDIILRKKEVKVVKIK